MIAPAKAQVRKFAKSPSACTPRRKSLREALERRRAKHLSKYKHDMNSQRLRTPEQTEAGRRHRQLFAAWVAKPNRDTFAAFILSAYC